jgi:hypothetical protein
MDYATDPDAWWCEPIRDVIRTSTMVPEASLPMALLCPEGHVVFDEPRQQLWLVEVESEAPIYEVVDAEDWLQLATCYPRYLPSSAKPDWQRWTGWSGGWVLPDWMLVAQDWAGVHMTVGAYADAAYRPLPANGHCAFLAGWNPDETVWLRAVVEPRLLLGEVDVSGR